VLGQLLVARLQVWAKEAAAAAIDSAPFHARGGVWQTGHRGKRATGVAPVRDTTIERFFAHFKDVLELLDRVPTRGRKDTLLLLIGSVYIYQLVLFLQLELGQ